jgi:hypothetical protein
MTLIPENVFRRKRAQQLCAFLFRWDGATRFSFDKIAALLYLAERQCYGEHGLPLTYDRILNTYEGPSLCKTLDLVLKRQNPAETMSEFSLDEIETIEWQYDPAAPGEQIPLETILQAVGFSDEEITPQIANLLDTQIHA